jgi:hypothetical protein
MQFDVATRNAQLLAFETELGASPLCEGFTGSVPANPAAADSGTKVFSMTLPADPFSAPSGGVMSKSGTWQDLLADAAGTVTYIRLKTSGGVCKGQLTASGPGGGGEVILINPTLTINQPVQIDTLTITAGGA